MSGRLENTRVLVTHADRYIGPPVVELFHAEGAEVVADETDYTTGPQVAADVVAAAGEIDVPVANVAGPPARMQVTSAVRGSFEAQIPAGRLGEGREGRRAGAGTGHRRE